MVYCYLITYDANKGSFPEELKEKLKRFGEVKFISGSVYVLISQKELNVELLFKKLSCYIDESTYDPEKLFVARLGRRFPPLELFHTLD